jgi:8-oxo-dGTP pyrophosphatase MutT (NUDIX family)
MSPQQITVRKAVQATPPETSLTQLAALCWRALPDGRREVLLVTSSTGRWILPKGWPIGGQTAVRTALTEAWEEGGIKKARALRRPVGSYLATKITPGGDALPCLHKVYAVEVRKAVDDFPERDRRERLWIAPAAAADLVQEEGLKDILRRF